MLLRALFLVLASVTAKASENKKLCDLFSNIGTRQNVCFLSPETIEGPYHIDELLERSDITDGEQGIPLDLTFTIRDTKTCEPLPNVIVDIWHCNASGFYSGFLSQGNGYGTSRGIPTDGSRFLRGIQTTNENGEVRFKAIYPGWYVNRTVHIHMQLYDSLNTTAQYTGQLYFNEDINDAVSIVPPYIGSENYTRTLNRNDQYFNSGQGTQTTLQVVGSVTAGYTASLTIGIERLESSNSTSSMSSMFNIFIICWLAVQVSPRVKRFL